MAAAGIGLRQTVAAHTIPHLPAAVRRKVVPPEYDWSAGELRSLPQPGGGSIRCLIAPANYAGQGYLWSQAASSIPGVSCTNMQIAAEKSGFQFSSNTRVSPKVFRSSHIWSRRQIRRVADSFTHVLIEAQLPILGYEFKRDLIAEIEFLRAKGLKVGTISHGSDTRIPSRHLLLEPDSPFRYDLDGWTEMMEQKTLKNHQILDSLGLPEFVSTPDLLEYRPAATWLPTLAETEKWLHVPDLALLKRTPVVLHVPSSSALKGSSTIRAAMMQLSNMGLIEYRELTGLPHAEMPGAVAGADIVIDQLGMGLYGVASIEGMLAGRVVVAQVWESTRKFLFSTFGQNLPIVEANAHNIGEVVADLVSSPERMIKLGDQGRQFATHAHSAANTAAILRGFLET